MCSTLVCYHVCHRCVHDSFTLEYFFEFLFRTFSIFCLLVRLSKKLSMCPNVFSITNHLLLIAESLESTTYTNIYTRMIMLMIPVEIMKKKISLYLLFSIFIITYVDFLFVLRFLHVILRLFEKRHVIISFTFVYADSTHG